MVTRSQSLRNKTKKRPKLYSLATATASLYVEQSMTATLPDTTLEESSEYEYSEIRPVKKSLNSIRRSQSFQKSKSKSPAPGVSTTSVLDSMHMYTVAEELAKIEYSRFGRLSKHYLERLDLGSASFDTCLAIETPRKEHTTFRTPIGMRQRPVSSLGVQMVAMRNDGNGGVSRSGSFRLKHLSAADVATLHSGEDHNIFPATNGMLLGLGGGGGIVLRRRLGMPGQQPRPVSASFVDPPTIRRAVVPSSRLSLQPQGGSLTDLTRPDSPAQSESPTLKLRPKRPAPQAPGGGRPPSRTGTPDSGRSTPKSYRTQSPLVGQQRASLHSSSHSSQDTLTGVTPNGVGFTHGGAPVAKGYHTPGSAHEYHVVPPTHQAPPQQLPGIPRNPSFPQLLSPQLPSPPQLTIHRNTSSPQLPTIPPIQEEDPAIPVVIAPEIHTPSSPRVTNGGLPTVPPFLRRDSLYVSPRKQSLTVNTVDKQRLRASQILETGGIRGGDLSVSRLDLLEAIRKGIQLKQVKEKEREEMVSMPWDVAAILERRLVLELDSDSEYESDDTEWEDD